MAYQISNNKSGSLGQYILGKTLGEGTFGKVKIATHIKTGEKVNLSIIKINIIIIIIIIKKTYINYILI
jgi:5'-AMP-activated protein kinase catalytic alpha subunit